MKVMIYSDGGADPNPGIGGWAAILRYGKHEKVLTGNDPQTTNNRMELTAAIHALQVLSRPSQIEFYTDSEYLRRGITEWIETWAEKGWQRSGGKPIPNADLWQRLWPLTHEHEIEWHWVRGHSGDPLNERVDELARAARLEITPETELPDDVAQLFIRGACKGNPGPGGWGVILEQDGETVQASGAEPATTNNRMELLAAIEGLKLLPPGSDVQILTTSDYLFQGATRWIHGWRRRGWQKKGGDPVANADLWRHLDQMMNKYRVHWVNAKGEQGEELLGLDEAQQLARSAIDIV